MAAPLKWTEEKVEAEITRLNNSEYVKLARKEKQIKERRKQYMFGLQFLETRGKQLASMGCTRENLEQMLFGEVEE